MITGIVVALPEELGALLTGFPGFAGGRRIAKGSCIFVTQTLAVAYAGAGPKNARLAAERLVAGGATRLISWGCAAALAETLKAGDLVLADTLIDADNQAITCACDWRDHAMCRLLQYLPVYSGALAESETIVSASEDKKRLRSKTDAIALDMESIAVAKVALQKKLPFLSIRAIADPFDMSLPTAINYALNDQGDIVLSRLLTHLAMHPGQLPGIIKLGFCFGAAKKTLRLAAKHLNTVLDFTDITSTTRLIHA